jgi:hypothetical protein
MGASASRPQWKPGWAIGYGFSTNWWSGLRSNIISDMKYMVRCFSKGGWGGNEPREVEAESAHRAAETLCGGPLEYTGRFSELRAEVWPINKPASKLLLYRSYQQSN